MFFTLGFLPLLYVNVFWMLFFLSLSSTQCQRWQWESWEFCSPRVLNSISLWWHDNISVSLSGSSNNGSTRLNEVTHGQDLKCIRHLPIRQYILIYTHNFAHPFRPHVSPSWTDNKDNLLDLKRCQIRFIHINKRSKVAGKLSVFETKSWKGSPDAFFLPTRLSFCSASRVLC